MTRYISLWSAGILVAVIDDNKNLWWADNFTPAERAEAYTFPRFDITQQRMIIHEGHDKVD